MSARLLRALMALGVVALSLWVCFSSTPQLGLDLSGGTQIVLEAHDTPQVKANSENTDRALEVLRGRVDSLGVSESTLSRSGERRIIVELPGVQDPTHAAEVVGQTAQLTFHPVLGAPATLDEKPTPSASPTASPSAGASTAPSAGASTAPSTGPTASPSAPAPSASPSEAPAKERFDASKEQTIPDEDGQPLLIGPAQMTGDKVKNASAAIEQQGVGWNVNIDFRQGGKIWASMTGAAACHPAGDPRRRVAILLDGAVISSPQVNETVGCNVGINGGSTQITGDFSAKSSRDLATLIKGGALPLPVEIVSQNTIGPTLGKAAIKASAEAAIIGLILTGLFIIFIYRMMGALASLALVLYAGISYALLTMIGATLTLPGLAGFVLSIGMAIDANVLVFERAREEYHENPKAGLSAALDAGYRKAWTAIWDSNVTTLLAAALLFALATGPVKGFGVTLTLGVLASMFSGLVVARVFTDHAVRFGWVKKHPGFTGIGSLGRVRTALIEKNPDLMGRRKLWLGLSGALLIASLVGIATQGLNLGVEFTGGRQIEYSTSKPISADTARAAIADAGFANAVVQTTGDGTIAVRTGQLTNAEATKVLEAVGTVGGEVDKVRDELIGPSMGKELRRNALIAFGIAILLQMLYLAYRFRWTFGAAAIFAMFHDVFIVVGFFAWLDKPIDGVFLAAVLTIVGLSVNDTVVTFDRVRERAGRRSGDIPAAEFARATNTAVLETAPRTVNTGMGTILILATLAILGGDSLVDFSVALLIGMIVGTWSSAFTASPMLVVLENKWPFNPAKVAPRVKPREVNEHGAVL